MFRHCLAAALAAPLGLAVPAFAQEVTLSLAGLEFKDFFGSCYPRFVVEVSPEGSVDEVAFHSATVFSAPGSIFRPGVELGTRTCSDTATPGGGSGFSCSTSGEDDLPCERVSAVLVSDFRCDGAPCASVTVIEAGLLASE